MDNKERCRILKEIRKETAEKIGVELNQTECTYKGECSGTCPKCRQEEEKLNKALLGGKVAAVALASSLALSGCASDTLSGNVEVVETESTEDTCNTDITEGSGVELHQEGVETLSGDVERVNPLFNFLQ